MSKQKSNHSPMRQCAVCMRSFPKEQLLRIAEDEAVLKIDSKNSITGRGAYICKRIECIEKAKKKHFFGKKFRRAISREELATVLESAAREIE
ncbi:MAG: YlxR family protein [Anaerovoracaceae bacterium]